MFNEHVSQMASVLLHVYDIVESDKTSVRQQNEEHPAAPVAGSSDLDSIYDDDSACIR